MRVNINHYVGPHDYLNSLKRKFYNFFFKILQDHMIVLPLCTEQFLEMVSEPILKGSEKLFVSIPIIAIFF